MRSARSLAIFGILLLGHVRNLGAIDALDLYMFRSDLDESVGPGDDVSSGQVNLSVPIVFFGQRKYSLFVNLNGHISFGSAQPAYSSQGFPLGYDAVAPFYADFDNRAAGEVYYRESTDPLLLSRAASDINKYFAPQESFEPKSLFIATWDKVGSFDSGYAKLNTIQAVIASSGYDSYTMFLYPEDGIQWAVSDSKDETGAPTVFAQIGFDSSSRDKLFALAASGTSEVENIATSSNFGQAGVWMFHTGNVRQVTEPQIKSGESEGNIVPSAPHRTSGTCNARGATVCHQKSTCQDYVGGFCCSCSSNFNGNGFSCIENAVPQRVNGKLTGALDGSTLNRLETHSYIVTTEGKTYTAMSKISPSLGYSMQLLFALGEVTGWLYADRQGGPAKNGFTLTGGAFNYTATLAFATGESVTVRQHYKGTNQLNYVSLATVIDGSLPKLPDGAELQIVDHDVAYFKVAQGGIRSSATKTVIVNKQQRVNIQVDEIIQYNECQYNVHPSGFLHSVHHHSYSVAYDENDLTVRYNVVSAVGLQSADVCVTSNCDINADCSATADAYTCTCKDGYQGSGQQCEDIDECESRAIECAANSRCINTIGSYLCHCNNGYELKGTVCVRKQVTCEELNCNSNAFCVNNLQTGQPSCQCFLGFQGDGQTCTAVVPCADCHANALCIRDVSRFGYSCVCSAGFVGDGILSCLQVEAPTTTTAVPATTSRRPAVASRTQPAPPVDADSCVSRPELCDQNAQCTRSQGVYSCICKEGYIGDGRRCARAECSSHSQCGDNGQCHYDRELMKYRCKCREGFITDGRRCVQLGEKTCNEITNCDVNARCVESLQGPQCVCSKGFEGNGYSCKKRLENCRTNPGLCDRNAQCATTSAGVAICLCSPGYAGDGLRCIPVQDSGNYLLLAQGTTVLQLPVSLPASPDKGKRILYRENETIIAIAVDCRDRYMFWTDIVTKTVSRATLGSPNDVTVIASGLSSPEGLAVDWISRNVYWTDSGLDRIEVSRLDGTFRKVLVHTGLVNPRAIQVDPIRGKLYWSDWNRQSPKIEVANLDGSDRQILVDKNLGLPNGLSFDPYRQEVCWADAGTQKIECVRADGTERRTIYDLATYPFALTTFRDVFYWTDWNIMSVQSKSRQGDKLGEALAYPAGGHGKGYGIAAVPLQCFPGSNACAYNNGGCRYLCLPISQYARTCTCPNDASDECNDLTKIL